jgi:cell division protein FtsN
MKRIILAAMTLALLTSGCKVFKSSKKSKEAPKTEAAAETKVFSAPPPTTGVRENPTSDVMYETANNSGTGKPVSARSEKFTMSDEDQAVYGNKTFFVIVGSFSSNDNANKFKKDLTAQGFKPIILHSETGNFRVCVDTFTDEAAARSRVQKIRIDYPKYADSWLLIKK